MRSAYFWPLYSTLFLLTSCHPQFEFPTQLLKLKLFFFSKAFFFFTPENTDFFSSPFKRQSLKKFQYSFLSFPAASVCKHGIDFPAVPLEKQSTITLLFIIIILFFRDILFLASLTRCLWSFGT